MPACGRRRLGLVLLCLLGAAQVAGCSLQNSAPQVVATAANNLLPTPATAATPTLAVQPAMQPLPSPTAVAADSGWQSLREGLEHRALNLRSADGEWLESITMLRLDPAHFRFDVGYQPGEPQGLAAWQAQTGALLVVNGGFFTEANEATGLVVAAGQHYGSSYEQFGGMFAVTEAGPELRWLPQQPYDAGEHLLAALQSFPMLLTPGGEAGVRSEDGQRARRTVVAQDGQERILFLVANQGHFTLYELSRYLQATDLGLELNVALNLDGGASSGLLLAEPEIYMPAFELLPTVIAVYER